MQNPDQTRSRNSATWGKDNAEQLAKDAQRQIAESSKSRRRSAADETDWTQTLDNWAGKLKHRTRRSTSEAEYTQHEPTENVSEDTTSRRSNSGPKQTS